MVEKIVEHRWLSRLKDAYADSLPGLANPHTGRVHTTFSHQFESAHQTSERARLCRILDMDFREFYF